MKVVAYTALKYGADYLGYAIRSIIDYVDEYHVLYAVTPSHGHSSSDTCPETETQLHEIAWQAASTKLRWHTGTWAHEGEQRGAIYQFVPDADAIIVLDSDEIYSPLLISNINEAIHNRTIPTVRHVRLPFIHYWRSFYRCVMHDPAFPIRLIFPNAPVGELGWQPTVGVVNHMGYAIRPEITAYKWGIHGHKNELRHDVNWFKDVYLANRQFDCHPVGSEYWNPEAINPGDYMPFYMQYHPFANMEVIE